MVRKLIKKYGYKLIKFIVPEIKILSRNLNWDYIDYSCYENTIGTTVNIASPAHINHTCIGDYSYISVNAWISHTDIGRFCSIGPNFLCGWGIHPTYGISTSPMFYSTMKQNGITLSSENKIEERRKIKIGNDVFIGANVTILDGVTIGDGAVLGAGSIVSKDIPPYAIAAGSPIQIIRYRFEKDQIDRLLKIKWWHFDKDKLEDVEKMFFLVDEFIHKYERQ
jgi:virginiamycin A acetyltransferase